MPAKRDNPYRMTAKLDVENKAVVLTVLKKETETTPEAAIDTRTYAISGLHADVQLPTVLYGLSKKLQDSQSDVPVGPDKLGAIDETYAQLASGKWESERVGRAPVVSAEIEALAAILNMSVGEVQSNLRNRDAAYKETLFKNPKVVEKAAEIRKAREAAEGVDLTAMLGAAA